MFLGKGGVLPRKNVLGTEGFEKRPAKRRERNAKRGWVLWVVVAKCFSLAFFFAWFRGLVLSTGGGEGAMHQYKAFFAGGGEADGGAAFFSCSGEGDDFAEAVLGVLDGHALLENVG